MQIHLGLKRALTRGLSRLRAVLALLLFAVMPAVASIASTEPECGADRAELQQLVCAERLVREPRCDARYELLQSRVGDADDAHAGVRFVTPGRHPRTGTCRLPMLC
jgi:hypothetical protein